MAAQVRAHRAEEAAFADHQTGPHHERAARVEHPLEFVFLLAVRRQRLRMRGQTREKDDAHAASCGAIAEEQRPRNVALVVAFGVGGVHQHAGAREEFVRQLAPPEIVRAPFESVRRRAPRPARDRAPSARVETAQQRAADEAAAAGDEHAAPFRSFRHGRRAIPSATRCALAISESVTGLAGRNVNPDASATKTLRVPCRRPSRASVSGRSSSPYGSVPA